MPSRTIVVYERRRWWRRTRIDMPLHIVRPFPQPMSVVGSLFYLDELITPRGHDDTDRERCAARGCYMCRAVLLELANQEVTP